MAYQSVDKYADLWSKLREKYPDVRFSLYDHTPDCPEGYIMTADNGEYMYQVSYFEGGYTHEEQADKLAQRLSTTVSQDKSSKNASSEDLEKQREVTK